MIERYSLKWRNIWTEENKYLVLGLRWKSGGWSLGWIGSNSGEDVASREKADLTSTVFWNRVQTCVTMVAFKCGFWNACEERAGFTMVDFYRRGRYGLWLPIQTSQRHHPQGPENFSTSSLTKRKNTSSLSWWSKLSGVHAGAYNFGPKLATC